MKKRVFSGIQPTGRIHIGNYLGAIRHWVEFQQDFENILCIVDLHAITLPQAPGTLKAKTREVAGLLVSAGIDPQRSVIFTQSHIGAHAELAWILNCLIPFGWMLRMTQFKEKSGKQKGKASVGLFDYPALMAADILLYETDFVPVGADQKQHMELTRDVAQKFNAEYGETFKIPDPIIPVTGARIMALDDPERKMSKSGAGQSHAIYLLDSPDEIRSKVMQAKTDSFREIRFDRSRAGVNNLLTIYALFTERSRGEIESRFEGKGYGELKSELAEVIVEALRPLQRRYFELMADTHRIEAFLLEGAEKMRPLAKKTLDTVKERVGLG